MYILLIRLLVRAAVPEIVVDLRNKRVPAAAMRGRANFSRTSVASHQWPGSGHKPPSPLLYTPEAHWIAGGPDNLKAL